jgi:hypothetical protein
MYCTDFEYDGRRLSEYGMMVCSFNGTQELETASSGADITFQQLRSGTSDKFNLYSSIYESPYTTIFQICRNPCIANEEMIFLPEEISAIQKWLCRKKYHKFKIDQDGYRNLYWNSVFSSKQIMQNGEIIGLELTMYADSPYAYLDDVSLEFECEPDVPFTIFSQSDEEGWIYPYIEILCLGNSIEKENNPGIKDSQMQAYSLEISNSMDYKNTKIKGCKINETIFIDGKNLIISSSDSTHESLANDFNYCFPRIFNTFGNNKNNFKINMHCIIKFRYAPIKKIGL